MTDRAEMVIAGGPNGSGKSTFAVEYLASHPMTYVSADAIAARVNPEDPESARVSAGREFFREAADCIDRSRSFLVESTLAGRSLLRLLDEARRKRFRATLAYIFLDSPDVCNARIRERVRKGGHNVDPHDVVRRFYRGVHRFWNVYRFKVDSWHLLYNGGAHFQSVAVGEEASASIRDETLFQQFLSLKEMRGS